MLTARFHSNDKETEPYASAARPVEYAACGIKNKPPRGDAGTGCISTSMVGAMRFNKLFKTKLKNFLTLRK